MAKKKPFQDRRGKWYAIIGAKKPRPFSEKVLKKALKAIKKAKRKLRVKVHTPEFVEAVLTELATPKAL